MGDYSERKYLSSIESAKILDISVRQLHSLVQLREINCKISGSGQKRFQLSEIKKHADKIPSKKRFKKKKKQGKKAHVLEINNTIQRIIVKSSTKMSDLDNNSVHLMITSPPYFNAKMYTRKKIKDNLGNIHNLSVWFEKIGLVWSEVFRVLQPGRKAFINIMNLPIREKNTFRSLNLVGKTIDVMEKIGFIFKRDIIWHKTHGVRAHFGTYPYPGGILLNNMHEFILEFNKPQKAGNKKYAHLTKAQKEESRLDKQFWLSIKNTDVWLMSPQNSSDGRSHVAPFPYELPYRLIKAFSFIGEIVLDPFLGGGTTLKAAADLKRNGVGYEIVPEIANTAVSELSRHQIKLFP